jgi:hypothetical protein
MHFFYIELLVIDRRNRERGYQSIQLARQASYKDRPIYIIHGVPQVF